MDEPRRGIMAAIRADAGQQAQSVFQEADAEVREEVEVEMEVGEAEERQPALQAHAESRAKRRKEHADPRPSRARPQPHTQSPTASSNEFPQAFASRPDVSVRKPKREQVLVSSRTQHDRVHTPTELSRRHATGVESAR